MCEYFLNITNRTWDISYFFSINDTWITLKTPKYPVIFKKYSFFSINIILIVLLNILCESFWNLTNRTWHIRDFLNKWPLKTPKYPVIFKKLFYFLINIILIVLWNIMCEYFLNLSNRTGDISYFFL